MLNIGLGSKPLGFTRNVWPLIGVGMALWGLLESLLYLWRPDLLTATGLRLIFGVGTGLLVVWFARSGRSRPVPDNADYVLVVASGVVCVLLAVLAFQAFPLSADEYGYNYLATTLAHGHLWNAPEPAALRPYLETLYIVQQEGKRVSQYPPGWPAVLAAFSFVGVPRFFANPVLQLFSGLFLALSLRQLGIPAAVRAAVVAIALLAPFALFTNASFLNHGLVQTALLAVIWLDLRDGANPHWINRVGIGLAFSVLLTTRYEAFAIAWALFMVDGLWRRRLAFIPRMLPAAAGALPIVLLFCLYNWKITGNPLETTLTWSNPWFRMGLYGYGVQGQHSPLLAAEFFVRWSTSWMDFASTALLLFYVIALWVRVRTGTLRWFDLILPAAVAFFTFYPDYGGIQHGPRYWFIGWAPMMLTVACGLSSVSGVWQVGRWRLDPVRLAAMQVAVFAGFTLGYGAFIRTDVNTRMQPLEIASAAPAPAGVLIPDWSARYVSWQSHPQPMYNQEFTRNGMAGLNRPVLLLLDLGSQHDTALCAALPDRKLFRYRTAGAPTRGWLEAIHCNPGVTSARR